MPTIWNEENKERLRKFVAADMTAREIATEFGISRNALISATHRLDIRLTNIKLVKWTEERVAELKKLVSEGFTTRECAQRLGTTRMSVSDAARRAGVSFAAKRGYSPRIKAAGQTTKPKVARVVYSISASGAAAKNEYEITNLRQAEVQPLNLTFDQLDWGDCRYPVTEAMPHLFCGQPKLESSSYCLAHHYLCHNYHVETNEERTLRKRMFTRAQKVAA